MKGLGSILLLLCLSISSNDGFDVHRPKRQVPPPSFSAINKSENGSLNLDPEIERMINKAYLSEFFEELTDDLPWQITYLIDQRSFLKEFVDIKTLEEFPGIIDFDFDQHIRQKQDIFYPLYLHEQEMKKELKPHRIEDENGFLNVESEKLYEMLNNVFTYPRNYRMSSSYRQGASDYISEKLGSMGLVLGLQSFMPTKFKQQFDGYNPKFETTSLPTGMNMFAIYPGELWGTSDDRLVIIGSHWDTVDTTDGYNDNGSGVATLLELARLIVESKCRPKNSIVFVAFDLEEMGAQGSQEFVNRYLLPSILRKYNQTDIAGAFIVDTIMTFNQTLDSQIVPDDWKKLDPEMMKSIEADGKKGDFLAIVGRRELDDELSQVFNRHWAHIQNRLPQNEKYKTRRFTVNATKETPTLDELIDMMPFVRSDHIRFWVVNETDYTSFPSILFTDTGPQRAGMASCYHRPCDSVRAPYDGSFVTDFEFFRQTVQALLNTVLELSRANCLKAENLDDFNDKVDEMKAEALALEEVPLFTTLPPNF